MIKVLYEQNEKEAFNDELAHIMFIIKNILNMDDMTKNDWYKLQKVQESLNELYNERRYKL